MLQSIKKTLILLLLVIVYTNCNQGTTLQTYYVDNEQRPGFVSFDVPVSVINIEAIEMTDEQRKAYKSVDKLNVLTYMTENTDAENYKIEIENVKTILKNPKYQELVRGGNSTDGRFVIKFLGDVNNIDELILFGNVKNKGFMIARVLGDNMNAHKIYSLKSVIENAKFDDTNLNKLKDFF